MDNALPRPIALPPPSHTPWDDALFPCARSTMAARSRAARALAASVPAPGGLRAWDMRPGSMRWAGDEEAGAALFEDGSALLGTTDDVGTLRTPPLAFCWSHQDPALPGAHSRQAQAYHQRIADLAWEATQPGRWSPPAEGLMTWTQLANGRRTLTPWGAVHARRTAELDTRLGLLVWLALRAAGLHSGALYGSYACEGALHPPTLVVPGRLQDPHIGTALFQALRATCGPSWMWRLVGQTHAGVPALIAAPIAHDSAHHHARLLARHPMLALRR